jgi:hypothetical protein
VAVDVVRSSRTAGPCESALGFALDFIDGNLFAHRGDGNRFKPLRKRDEPLVSEARPEETESPLMSTTRQPVLRLGAPWPSLPPPSSGIGHERGRVTTPDRLPSTMARFARVRPKSSALMMTAHVVSQQSGITLGFPSDYPHLLYCGCAISSEFACQR